MTNRNQEAATELELLLAAAKAEATRRDALALLELMGWHGRRAAEDPARP